MKLTQASIARLPSDKADAVYYDDELDGFGIRIRAGGLTELRCPIPTRWT